MVNKKPRSPKNHLAARKALVFDGVTADIDERQLTATATSLGCDVDLVAVAVAAFSAAQPARRTPGATGLYLLGEVIEMVFDRQLRASSPKAHIRVMLNTTLSAECPPSLPDVTTWEDYANAASKDLGVPCPAADGLAGLADVVASVVAVLEPTVLSVKV